MITADRRRTPSDGFCCGEKLERQDALTLVVFQCNLPSKTKLEFSCREPSCGALEVEEESAQLADEDYAVDANFFDEGYSMAGSTGFKVCCRCFTCIFVMCMRSSICPANSFGIGLDRLETSP